MNDVLVVEDKSAVRALVGALLRVEGIRSRAAVHGGEALVRVREARPAMVLLDIQIPHVNGVPPAVNTCIRREVATTSRL